MPTANNQFTPGPWFNSVVGRITNGPETNTIAHCYSPTMHMGGTLDANARLIASAPALFEALQFVEKWIALRKSKGAEIPDQLTNSVSAALALAQKGAA